MSVRLFAVTSGRLQLDAAGFDHNGPFTVFARIRSSVAITNWTGGIHVTSLTQASSNGDSLEFTPSANPWLSVDIAGSNFGNSGTSTIAVSTWYYIALVRESATSVKMYVNGVQEGSTITNSVSGRAGAGAITIGTFYNDGTSTFAQEFNGLFSDVRIWAGAALSAVEIARERSLAAPSARLDNLYAWAPFTRESGLTVVAGRRIGARFTSGDVIGNWGITDGIEPIYPRTSESQGSRLAVLLAKRIPTLSLPGVQDISFTSVRPKVTLTF